MAITLTVLFSTHAAGVIVNCLGLDDGSDSHMRFATIGGTAADESDGGGIIDSGQSAASDNSRHEVTVLACAIFAVLFEGDGAGVIDVESADTSRKALGDKNTSHLFASVFGVSDFNGAFDSAVKVLGIEGEDAREIVDIPRAKIGGKSRD